MDHVDIAIASDEERALLADDAPVRGDSTGRLLPGNKQEVRLAPCERIDAIKYPQITSSDLLKNKRMTVKFAPQDLDEGHLSSRDSWLASLS